ncbi:protein SAR DEFICIENT 4-like [Phragmites australis]|uniref:protein SAR DEFICIENT 4-like n=1 Tax=Phragmites australis TaxID=29695 RepID=UPI002D7850B5|nr:protein SAR DEFICIENT 4-like [Phragmites australis]
MGWAVFQIPTTPSAFSLFSSATGAPLASFDGSALASSLLASPSPPPATLALAPYVAEAHLAALLCISRVLVWNRTRAKPAALVAMLRESHPAAAVEEVGTMDEAVAEEDVVSFATGSREPIVSGELLRPRALLGLVGSFTPAMRECDDEALRRGRVFIDFEAAMEEAGELVGAV